MEIQVTAKHLKVSPALSDYLREKMEKAQKYFDHIVWGQAILSVEKRSHNAEFVIHAPGQTVRSLATAADLYAAIDLASDKIDAQLKKYKERLKERYKAREQAASPLEEAGSAIQPAVIKQPVEPMTADEAAAEMESMGQEFRLYQDKTSHQIHVIFRRGDDTLAIIQPVKKLGR
ncbi:MAG: ribosome-associated translation inhibitor RaiA [Elusimicrobia bacterium]|nr:ribosome-associated translation inhibitor RaiA [Elusimicrobiota bacterium]MDE2424402.1 ribosome-associated translation inhibitor RaiA [Elusimicrobiota bacterium]